MSVWEALLLPHSTVLCGSTSAVTARTIGTQHCPATVTALHVHACLRLLFTVCQWRSPSRQSLLSLRLPRASVSLGVLL